MSTEVFTTAEVAQRLGVSVLTVNKWRRAGGPNSRAASRGWRFPASEVERLVERLMADPSAPAPQ